MAGVTLAPSLRLARKERCTFFPTLSLREGFFIKPLPPPKERKRPTAQSVVFLTENSGRYVHGRQFAFRVLLF